MLRKLHIIDISLLVLVFLLLFVGYFHPITAITQDLGRHLLLGKMIAQTGQIPKTNLFSYTYPDFPFINTHYLSEIIFSALSSAFGFTGLLVVMTLLMLIAYGLLVSTGYRLIRHTVLIAIASMLNLPILFERTDLRPEIFSFLLTAIFIVVLYRYREKFTALVFLLVPLELLWVNMHIYFIIGILIVGLFVIDVIITHRHALSSKYTSILVIVFCATLLVTLINPNGLQGAIYPFHVLQNYGYTIEENQSMFLLESLGFQKLSFPYFKITVFLLFLSLFLTLKRSRRIDWLLAIVFTYLALSAVRNFPLFVFATLIPFMYSFSLLYEKLNKTRMLANKRFKSLAVILVMGILLLQIKVIVAKKGVGLHEVTGAKNGVTFFEENNLRGPLFNNFDIGGYLIYRLYPKERVFVDGRPEAYPKDFFQNTYIPMQQDEVVFAKQDKKYHFNTIFFSHTDQTPWADAFLKRIVNTPLWRVVYLDDTIVILVKNNKSNASLIERFSQTEKNPAVSHLDKQNRNSLLQLAHFFNTVGWTEPEILTYQDILAIDPRDCQVLYNLSVHYAQQQNLAAEIVAKQYQTHCQ
ncbi:MAG: hypothetical protein HY428_00580 [Candidatus Levybacteria bacterium]|nr:hypothetical protein [Candidatus Levybacteria bacterium]